MVGGFYIVLSVIQPPTLGYMTELTLKFTSAPAILFLETQLPIRAVKDLNKYLDKKHNKGAESFANKLVGQIAHGEQLKMDPKDKLVEPFI